MNNCRNEYGEPTEAHDPRRLVYLSPCGWWTDDITKPERLKSGGKACPECKQRCPVPRPAEELNLTQPKEHCGVQDEDVLP